MSESFYDRTSLLIGEEGVSKLKKSHICIFGIGGVGGALTEALVRAGVGSLTIVDRDVIDVTNVNRQIFATMVNVGQDKVLAAKDRLLSINPNLNLITKKLFYLEETKDQFRFETYDYVADCVDTVSAKISLVCAANNANTPIISAMGAGNKLEASTFEVSDIYKTSVCPLARVMRKELKARGIKSLKVVYSKESPVSNKRPPGSISFVPPVMGYIMAGEIVKQIIY